MPAEYTRADALRIYLTGAGSHGGAQADVDASLGDYASSTEAVFLTSFIESGLDNIDVDHVGGLNGPGTGTLRAVTSGSIAWTPPDGNEGAAVAIANGETMIVEGGADPVGSEIPGGKFLRISRTSATALNGSAVVELGDLYDSVVGMPVITSAQATAGVTIYRCLALRNEQSASAKLRNLRVWVEALEGADVIDGGDEAHDTVLAGSGSGTIEIGAAQENDFSGWPTSGWCLTENAAGTARELVYYTSRTSRILTVPAAGRALGGTSARAMGTDDVIIAHPGITLAFEEPSAQPGGSFDTPSPSGLTWDSPREAIAAFEKATLNAGFQVGLWLRWHVPAGAVAVTGLPARVVGISFEGPR